MLVLFVAAAQAASLSSRGSVLRLRGGDGDDFRKEIHAKLNACPVFCILSGENNPVGVRLEDGTIETVWYTEPAEVMELYESMLMHSESVDGLHVGCTPLGEAFALCGGWDASEAAHKGRRIQGPREVVERASSALVAQLQAKGIESNWQLPLFCSDDFQSQSRLHAVHPLPAPSGQHRPSTGHMHAAVRPTRCCLTRYEPEEPAVGALVSPARSVPS